MSGAALSGIKWEMKPALLIFETNLSKRSAALLCSSTRRGYLALRTVPRAARYAFDLYGPKAIYAGEVLPIGTMLQHCAHINVSPTLAIDTQHVARISEKLTQNAQNQLLRYRSEHLPEVSNLEFGAARFSPDFNAVARALGECIVDAPDLQNEPISLLSPYSEEQVAERIDDLGMRAVSAALALSHQGKERVRVGEIADEVNRVLKGRGERLRFSPERWATASRSLVCIAGALAPLGTDSSWIMRLTCFSIRSWQLTGVSVWIRKETTCTVRCVLKINDLCTQCRLCMIFRLERHPNFNAPAESSLSH
jgi:hypothetical protein